MTQTQKAVARARPGYATSLLGLIAIVIFAIADLPLAGAGDFDGCTHNSSGITCPNTRLFGQLLNGNGNAIRETIVRIYDADPVDNDFVGQTWTDLNGNWELTFQNFTDCTGGSLFDPFHCPYPDDTFLENRRADAYMIGYARNDAIADVFCPALVCPPLGGTWTWPHGNFGPFDIRQDIGDGDQNYGTTTVGNADTTEAFAIFENLRQVWRFIEGQTGGLWVPQVGVEFPCKGGLFGLPCPGVSYFDPYITRHIFLERGESAFTHMHEHAHYIMYRAYDDSWPPSPEEQVGAFGGGNIMNTDCLFHRNPLPETCAWTEGWADFLPRAVTGSNALENTSGTVIGATPGERFEVLVAGALWDLLDTANDGYDQFSASFADIFNTLWSAGQGFCNTWVDPPVAFQCISSQRTFRDFYRDWRARGLNPIPVNAAAFQNRINLNNAPRVISFTAPTGTVASGSIVALTVVGADDTGGFIDGLISSARFEYSTNGGASWSLVPGLVQPAGANTFSLAWNLGPVTGTVNVRARVRDNLDADSGWAQSAPFLVQFPPDLVVQSIVTSPATPIAGQNMNVNVRVLNQGGLPAGGFYVDFYQHATAPPSGAGSFYCFVGGLAPAATFDCAGSVTYSPAGSYSLWARVDLDGYVSESDEGNNLFGPQTLVVQAPPDADSDGVPDSVDNCVLVYNPNQRDTNKDGYGNLCDADLNNDGIVNSIDLSMFKKVFLTNDADADFNGDGIVNSLDLSLLKKMFLKPPGPSGTVP